ncbi:MAG: hypothetical protein HYU66_09910, partial [Armatimonadetes bacterium]|nr:hypothetical protein [Armatimonadota bacterium]
MTVTWRWSHLGKQYSAGDISADRFRRNGDGDLLRSWGRTAYERLGNALLVYTPDLGHASGRVGATAENLAEPGGQPALRPAAKGRAATTWRIALPHVAVGLRVNADVVRSDAADEVKLSWSGDATTFAPVGTAEKLGAGTIEAVLDPLVSPAKHPMGLERLRVEVDLQTSTLSLPELEVGDNRVEYRCDSADPQSVRVTQRWVERTAWQPPPAPAAPAVPADGAVVEGTQVRFEWQPSASAAGIPDYRFELSEYSDMRWPLSPNFDKLVSGTTKTVGPVYVLPQPGLLSPGRTYHWRVKALAGTGVWGPWSPAWSFRCEAPGVPLFVRVAPARSGRAMTLSWQPNPQGRPPVKCRIYGSDEQGFTAHDEAYARHMGMGFVRSPAEYQERERAKAEQVVATAGNFLAEVKALSWPAAANRAFYRVVAVDEKGVRSGPSDLAEAPRPFIHTT